MDTYEEIKIVIDTDSSICAVFPTNAEFSILMFELNGVRIYTTKGFCSRSGRVIDECIHLASIDSDVSEETDIFIQNLKLFSILLNNMILNDEPGLALIHKIIYKNTDIYDYVFLGNNINLYKDSVKYTLLNIVIVNQDKLSEDDEELAERAMTTNNVEYVYHIPEIINKINVFRNILKDLDTSTIHSLIKVIYK